jgi:hypothetical protein
MWLAIAGVVVAAGMVLLWLFRRYPTTKRGMKQFAQRAAGKGLHSIFAHREDLLARAESMTEAELRDGVEVLITGEASVRSDWQRAFEKVGERAVPLLLRALEDPRCNSAAASEGLRARSGFEAITELLAEMGAVPVIARLARWSNSADTNKRRHAAFCIALTGASEAAERTGRALRSDNEKERTWALIGVGRAIRAGRVTGQFREEVFGPLAAIACGDAGYDSLDDRDAGETLMGLDPVKGAEVLLARSLSLKNPNLAGALEALNKHGTKIGPTTLWLILRHAKRQGNHPWTYVHAECLVALAMCDPGAAQPEVDEGLRSDDKEVRRGAVQAVRRLLDLPSPYEVWDRGTDFESLPRPVQHVAAVVRFKNEVENGGISQYFFNSSGDHWPVALEAFRAMGAAVCEDILQKRTRA